MKPLLAWLHVSDIHFGHGSAAHGWDQQLVLASLQADLAQVRVRGAPSPELILVTGDIAFSGACRVRDGQTKSTEYQEASRWLRGLGQELGIEPERIFVVPGNHDVQRSADEEDPAVARLVEELREGRLELDAALSRPTERALLARRQAHYLAWAAGFGSAPTEPPRPPDERLFWTRRMPVPGGLRVRLVGLNTALLCANDQDHGRLRLGNAQLVHALTPPIEPNELVVALSHHPLRSGWLADEHTADAWIRNHAHLHLSGHVHEADSEQARSGAGGLFVRVVAGAAHGERMPAGIPSGHGYNLAAVFRSEAGPLVLRVWPRRWSDKNKRFVEDTDNVPAGQPYSEHPLRLSLPGSALATRRRPWRAAGLALTAVAGLGVTAWAWAQSRTPEPESRPIPLPAVALVPTATEPARPAPSAARPQTPPEPKKQAAAVPPPPRQQPPPTPPPEIRGPQASNPSPPPPQGGPNVKVDLGTIHMGNKGVLKAGKLEGTTGSSETKAQSVDCGDGCTLEFGNQTSK